jgi:hypothetical protein
MNCFFHQERSAVGICKNCQRGLCPACAAEVADGLACKGKCESRVLLLGRLVESNERETQTAKKMYRSSGKTYTSIGIAMAVLAGFWNIFVSQLEHVPVDIPAAKYISVPFWFMAAVMVLVGISRRKNAS